MATNTSGDIGSTTQTTLGTVTIGTWNASLIPLAYGGTNANLAASNGGIFYSTASAGAILAGTATANQALLSGSSTTPAWSTATYPATTTINQLLYSSSANVIGGLATANSGVLITSSAGAPSISTTIPATTQANITAVGTLTAGTWNATTVTVAHGGTGDTSFTAYMPICGGTTTTGALQSVGAGTLGQTLVASSSTLPVWSPALAINRLINGAFQVWQRGAGATASFNVPASTTQYVADRWQIMTNANQACTVSLQAGATPNSNSIRVQRNSGQTGVGVIRLCQSLTIDMCQLINDYNLCFSFSGISGANYSATSSNLGYAVYTGTGATNKSGINGAFTGSSAVISGNLVLTTSNWPAALPASVTVGATVTQAAVELQFTPVGTAGANDYYQAQYISLISTNIQYQASFPDFNQELTRCQRFYQKSFPYNTVPAQNSGTYVGAIAYTAQIGSTVAGWSNNVTLAVPMLTATAPTFYDPSGADAKWYNISGSAVSGTATATYSGANNFVVNNPQVVADAAGNLIAVHWTIDCDLT